MIGDHLSRPERVEQFVEVEDEVKKFLKLEEFYEEVEKISVMRVEPRYANFDNYLACGKLSDEISLYAKK